MSDPMPRVEFYVLPDELPQNRLRVACQLAAKAWRSGLPVFLRGQDETQCGELDELLWHYRAERFIPHDSYANDPQAPVTIGCDQPPVLPHGVLINLASTLSPQIDQFSRIIEIVNQAPDLLRACRDNFRNYRQQGYDPQRVEL